MQNVTSAIVTGVIALLVLAGVIIGISAFKTSQQPNTAGCNSTAKNLCNAAWNLTANTEKMTNNFASQLGTVGTMLGVALILGAIGLLGFGIYAGAKRL